MSSNAWIEMNYSPIRLRATVYISRYIYAYVYIYIYIYINTHWKNYISISFRIEWHMIVVTVFFSIFWTKWNSIWFKIERKTVTTIIPFNLKGNGIPVFSVYWDQAFNRPRAVSYDWAIPESHRTSPGTMIPRGLNRGPKCGTPYAQRHRLLRRPKK